MDSSVNQWVNVFEKVYDTVAGVFTLACVAVLAVALVTLIFGHSGKSADASYAWIKRILCAWIVINTLGWTVPFMTDLFSGMQYQAGAGGDTSLVASAAANISSR